MTTQLVYVHALSPMRVGVSQGAGVIDLPVIREKHTGWPYLPGSSVKGVLRDSCTEAGESDDGIRIVFGPQADKASEVDQAGGVTFADIRIMFLPVRTFAGSFAWVTSPHVLARWQRDSLSPVSELAPVPSVEDQQITLPSELASRTLATGEHVILEDLRLLRMIDETVSPLLNQIARDCFEDNWWRDFFLSHTGIVSDTTFTYLSKTGMEITARNRIEDETKIVAQGQLWWEEAVPAETIFGGILTPTKQGLDSYQGDREKLLHVVRKGVQNVVQIGGSATVGRGLARVRIPLAAQPGGQP